jgi:hypothetical protein
MLTQSHARWATITATLISLCFLQALRAYIPLTVYGPVVWWKPFGEANFPLLALMSLAQEMSTGSS